MDHLSKITDKELLVRLDMLSRRENETTLSIIMHLLELERRKAYLELGYSSLFDFATRKLKYSEGAAMRRITAARSVRDYPEIYELLLKKDLSLSSLSLIAAILRKDNKSEVLRAVLGKPKTEVQQYIAAYRPKAALCREIVKPVAVVRAETKHTPDPALALSNAGAFVTKKEDSPKPHEQNEPVETRFELKFSVDAQTMEQINRAKTLMASDGRCPSLEELFKACLGVYLEKQDPKERELRRIKRAKRQENSESLQPPPWRRYGGGLNRHIPAVTRDTVLLRDGLCCSFTGPDGTRCSNKVGLELEHKLPFGMGGGHTEANLQVFCKRHNLLEAERVYGANVIQKYRRTKEFSSS